MSPSHGSPLKGIRVLILEDEFFLADDLARALSEAGGVPVGPVATVRQAEELVERERLDAAIVDLNLRGEMASEFIEGLAASQLPCLIVSGYGNVDLPHSVSRIRRVEKPISPASVMKALAEELERAI